MDHTITQALSQGAILDGSMKYMAVGKVHLSYCVPLILHSVCTFLYLYFRIVTIYLIDIMFTLYSHFKSCCIEIIYHVYVCLVCLYQVT